MDRGAWQTTVHGLAKSQTRLSNQHQAYLMWGISCYSFLCLLLRVFREVTCSHLCPEKMTSFPLVWLRAENMKFSGGLIMITSSMEFSRQEYRVGCYFLLQGIFLTQGLNLHLLGLLHRQTESLPLCQGKGETPPSLDYSENMY